MNSMYLLKHIELPAIVILWMTYKGQVKIDKELCNGWANI